MLYLKVKRLADFFMSVLGIIILSPVFVVLIILIKLDSKGPIIFKQKRVGINRSHFYIYKFRTMKIETPKETPTHRLEDPDKWITKTGKFLRKFSLDELPQIYNILKRDMSIIGPRPALWNQYDLLDLRDKNGSNKIRPGLTGWAQINGRDALTLEEKADLDCYYVKNIGLKIDIKCFLGTFTKLLRCYGVIEGKRSNTHNHKKPCNESDGK